MTRLSCIFLHIYIICICVRVHLYMSTFDFYSKVLNFREMLSIVPGNSYYSFTIYAESTGVHNPSVFDREQFLVL